MKRIYHNRGFLFWATICLIVSVLALSSAAPSLSLSWYKNNGSGMGDDIGGEWTINTNVSEDVVRVEFYLDGVLQQNDTAAPFSWNFKTANYSAGSHTFRILAYDVFGGSATAVSERNFVEYSFSSIIIGAIVLVVVICIVIIVTGWFWIKRKGKEKSR